MPLFVDVQDHFAGLTKEEKLRATAGLSIQQLKELAATLPPLFDNPWVYVPMPHEFDGTEREYWQAIVRLRLERAG